MKGVEYWEHRAQDHDVYQMTKSVLKQSLSLPNLPNDIIQIIFSYITTPDLKNLSILNKQFRQLMVPFLLSRVTTQWYKLLDEGEAKSSFLKQY